ncbi:MAG: peptidoglycan DD-metalloendopeptidase family protein [Gammaproteobacteria bacterium]|nr:peptidoglycan DD-metalloendopeptidase family protein [Gammaproteobacteria bacterium]
MSLISKDFRLHKQREEEHGHARLRWALVAIACAGIGAVIASTNTEETSQSAEIAAKSLPEFTAITKSTEELARESFSLSLPELQAQQKIIDEKNARDPDISPKQWREFTVKSGDNLARLFKRADIKPQQLDELMKSGDAVKKLRRIFPKDTIRVLSDSAGVLQALRYDIDQKSYLLVEREQGVLVAKTYNHKIETRQTHASAVIDSSLFLAGEKAGISDNIIMELANIFGWDIDFALDIRKGDNFTVLFEELYRDGEKISDGKILAADFVNDGKIFRAVRYTDPHTNNSEYYTPDGKSMRKAFIRSPVHFSRISSGFNLKRKHPILLNKRPHRGVDYAAKRGTPIFAAGDGKVIFKGKKGGYGKVMILQHGTKYTTLYAHLKTYNRKLRTGSRVKQGQTIAYVGSSGLATGPHLHYEFRVNGVHRNPLTVRLPESKPVPKRHMANFDLMTAPVIAQLDLVVTRPQQVALTND